MSDAAELVVTVTSTDTATAVLTRLESQLDRTAATADRTAAGIGGTLGGAQQRAGASALSLAQAQSRLDVQQAALARSQGDTARAADLMASAEQRLISALQGVDRESVAAVNAQRQLASIQTQVAREAQGSAGQLGTFGSALAKVPAIVGAAGAAFAAVRIGEQVAEWGTLGESVERTGVSFNRLAAQAGTTGDALLLALQRASGGEISDLNLQLAANRAQLLGVASTAEQFGVLMQIAKARAQDMGISTTQAFNDLVTGLGRGSALILDNLGITVSAADANRVYAEQIGKSAAQLTEAEKKQALINAVIAQGQASMAGASGQVDQYAGAWARAGAALENAKNRLATFVSTGLAPAATGFARVLEGSSGLDQAMAGLSNSLNAGGNATAYLAQALGLTAASVDSARATLAALGIVTGDTAGWTSQAAGAALQASTAFDLETQRAQAMTQGTVAAAAAAQQHATEINKDAAESLIASARADELAQAKAQLAAQAQAAAAAVAASGGNIQATAARLAASSSLIDQLTAAYLRLSAAQGAAGAAAASNRVPADAQRAMGIAQQTSAALDRQRQLMTPLQRAQDEYNRSLNVYGRSSQQAYDAETRLMVAQQSAARSRGGGGGGGAAKLSDQQKLNNSMAADQQRADQQAETAESQHQQRLLDIEATYQEKRRQAEATYNQQQLDGRASFYDQLGQIQNTKLRAQLSQQYEAAAAEAGRVAERQGADVAAKYMDAQTTIIQDRAKRQQDIEAAEKAKDKGKAEYLKGVDDLYRQAEDARLAKVTAGEGSIASERDKALADEARKNEEAQGKIADAADQSAARRIAAAQRAGQAIDAETAKATTLAQAYDRVAPAGQQPPPTAATPAPATAATAPDLGAAIGALRGAVEGVERAVRESGSAVERAVERGAGRVAGAVSSRSALQ